MSCSQGSGPPHIKIIAEWEPETKNRYVCMCGHAGVQVHVCVLAGMCVCVLSLTFYYFLFSLLCACDCDFAQ